MDIGGLIIRDGVLDISRLRYFGAANTREVIKVSVFSPGKGGARIALRRVEQA